MAKTLSENQISLLKDGLNHLLEKYEIEASGFMKILDNSYSDLENYNFENEEVDIWMNDEASTIEYSIDDMLRYLPNIDKLQYDDNSAWCNNIKQIIVEVDQWKAEGVNLKRYSFTSDTLSIKFVDAPFYIGIAAVSQGLSDDNYDIRPCTFYIAAEFDYHTAERLSKNEEVKILKQFLYAISLDCGISLSVGRFFNMDYAYMECEVDVHNRKSSVNYCPQDLLSYTKAMDYFSKAIEIEDEEIKYLHYYKIIEYFSPVASKKSAYNMLNLRLDALSIKNRDQKYLESIFQLTRDYDTSLKDKELATTVLRECADSLELFDVLPESIQKQIKKKFHFQKDITALNTTEKEMLDKDIGQILYSTRNQIVHAKSNYRPTGYECNGDNMRQLNIFMENLCHCLIIWNNRQPDEYRLD